MDAGYKQPQPQPHALVSATRRSSMPGERGAQPQRYGVKGIGGGAACCNWSFVWMVYMLVAYRLGFTVLLPPL
jgi:hypothetical protein